MSNAPNEQQEQLCKVQVTQAGTTLSHLPHTCRSPPSKSQSNIADHRVAKCHGSDEYVCVKIFVVWDKVFFWEKMQFFKIKPFFERFASNFVNTHSFVVSFVIFQCQIVTIYLTCKTINIS